MQRSSISDGCGRGVRLKVWSKRLYGEGVLLMRTPTELEYEAIAIED